MHLALVGGDLIPFILQNEWTVVKQEIEGRDVSVVFDRTTHLGEAIAGVLHFVDGEGNIQQQLLRLMLLAKSLKREEVARDLLVFLSTTLGVKPGTLLAAMRDRAAVNGAAMRTVKVHTQDDFIRSWTSLFSHSPKARLL